MAKAASSAQAPPTPIDPTQHLPLALLRSDAVPPAPTRSTSTIDWLPDFSGHSWVAYGASSLLVISHLPSPLSPDEALLGPLLRQVFELSGSGSFPVAAVSWSPVTPSIGELAAASENCVSLFAHDSVRSKGSFLWSQVGVLVHSGKVEAVRWSGSGDGIVTGGLDVVLWRRKTTKTWEIAWKFRGDEPQTLVSATWSIEGPSASASFCYHSSRDVDVSEANNVSKSVTVCYGCGNNEYVNAELCHPRPVSMIQWRPNTWPESRKRLSDLPRHVLLTCCLDGTLRLWCEVDNGKVRKSGKEGNQKGTRRSFCVGAVIEINQVLNGSLGVDVFLSWAADISGVYRVSEGAARFFSAEGHRDNTSLGQCEWLIGVGPGMFVSFWAVRCLDDVSPVRFPRVTLWKRQKLDSFKEGAPVSDLKDTILLNKVVTLRNDLTGPPEIFALIHLLPSNSLAWSLIYEKNSSNMEDASRTGSKIDLPLLPPIGALPLEGHSGKILQVVIHPCFYQAEFAASLDCNGLVLLWSVSAVSNHNLGLETLPPAWDVCGKIANHDIGSKYTSVRWVPSVFGEDLVILLGHIGGIDCFEVHPSQVGGGGVRCSYLCTIPLGCNASFGEGPTNIFAMPFHSNSSRASKYDSFLVLGIWTKDFRALSWNVTLLFNNLSVNDTGCDLDSKNSSLSFGWQFENTVDHRRYYIGVNHCSSEIPEPYSHDMVTCYSVVCPSSLIAAHDGLSSPENSIPAYIMATGCFDGTVQLWRSNSSKFSTPCIPWELVGEVLVGQGPVGALHLTDCGQKIATINQGSQVDGINTIKIWDTVHLAGAGTFVLEDKLSIDRKVVAFSWLALGNGQFIMGVCVENELQVYGQKHYTSQPHLNFGESLNLPTWSCIAVASTYHPIRDFLWGTSTTAVLIHDFHFTIHSQWLCLLEKMKHGRGHSTVSGEDYREEKDAGIPALVFMGPDDKIDDLQEHVGENGSGKNYESLEKAGVKKGCISNSLLVAKVQMNHYSSTSVGFWRIVDIAEKLIDTLPVFHPEVLLVNISAGNWKRANVAVRHLTEFLSSSVGSEKRHNSATHVHFVPQIHLGNYMEGLILKNSIDRGFQWSSDAKLPASSPFIPFNAKYDASDTGFSLSSTESGLGSPLESFENSHNLAACALEKLQMLAVVDLLNDVQHSSSAYKNLDEPGRRFWVALRFQQLHYSRKFGRSPSTEELVVYPQLYCWAFHSDCQDALLSSFLPNEPSWPEMRALGVGFWFTNSMHLRARMERLARSQYLRKKDPKDCALLYIALNRIQVLAGLFKVSKDEKDKPLVGFLSRNFQEEKNKVAALKNAYVLMGRHQLELAIAFFLLGGDSYSAISICTKNLGDDQLALVICRLVESCGGPLERHLITKFLLPSASERSDYWLGSLLEWQLGNYPRSFVLMLLPELDAQVDKSFISVKSIAFTDPNIGLYCLLLTTKNSMKNAIGEQNAAMLGRWATFMITTSFRRCGLPLEALDFVSSSPSIAGAVDQGSLIDSEHLGLLHLLLKPSSNNRLNWLSGDVASYLDVQAKLDLAIRYFSKLMKEHPGWPGMTAGSLQPATCSKNCQDYEGFKSTFSEKLYVGLSKIEQKFFVDSSCVIAMILVWLCSNGLMVVGYDILLDYYSRNNLQHKSHARAGICHLHKLLLKAAGDISHSVSRFILLCSITSFQQTSHCVMNDQPIEVRPSESDAVYSQGILLVLFILRVVIRIFCDHLEDATRRPLVLVDFFEYVAYSAVFWLQQDSEGLLSMLAPLLTMSIEGNSLYEVDMVKLKDSLYRAEERLNHCFPVGVSRIGQGVTTLTPHKPKVDNIQFFPEDERWHVVGVCFWQHMFSLLDCKLRMLSIEQEGSCSFDVFNPMVSMWRYSLTNLVLHGNSPTEINVLMLILAKLLKTALSYLSSYHVKLLVRFLHQKMVARLHVATLRWLKGSNLSQAKAAGPGSDDGMNDKTQLSTSDALWVTAADSNMILKAFEQGKIEWSHVIDYILFSPWTDFHQEISREQHPAETSDHEVHATDSSSGEEVVFSSPKGLFGSGRSIFGSWQKDATIVEGLSNFQNTKEIYKRDGELFEVMCINSIDECQAAVSSNRKGIVFFNWEAEDYSRHPSNHIWSNADWPPNGWAGSESTPVPTFVSPGVGLGSKKGTRLGLGGATIGGGSLSRSRRDFTAGGAFGLPGYAGTGASGLGWEVQEDFEELVDTPATVENIRTRAFSSHPSLPIFLVGSSNTHIYLWEFGKDKATATYGILPSANVPPPYALASISAVQFDQYGQRFATAALDGTVCTWQLEVGGRSNIRPTESSLCFNGHASDVTYVTSSGSIVATAGYSSNGFNVVVWDTLAPSATSRASILCHEGGARSIAVFDNVIGSGSVSPLIITGGKGGDVGIHDFRYIATGKTKKHRQHDNGEANGNPSSSAATAMVNNNKVGDQSSSGMLWYIPKAHLGSVTKISAIPRTSLFLTGSKDGDVKLWDAKAAKLVYHWPKLHERRTFLQPNSRGFGGVVRAAITDIQVVSHGFLTCGGDGTVKLVQLQRYQQDT